jgi:hypothetical protein
MTVAGLVSLAACGNSDQPRSGAGSTSKSSPATDVAAAKAAAGTANGRCPVEIDEMVEATAPTRTYKDPTTGREQKIGFCCDRCPKKFDKDPEQYMSRMRADPVKFGYTLP